MKQIFLNHQATTPVDSFVLERMIPYFSSRFVPQSLHNYSGIQIQQEVNSARESLASFIGATASEIIFTSGATESINLGIKGYSQNNPSLKIITTPIEHNAVLSTVGHLSRFGSSIEFIQIDEVGRIDLSNLESHLKAGAKLFVASHVNNEIAVFQDLKLIGNLCKKYGCLFFVDAAQSFGKIPINVKELNIDFLAASGHKIYGPKGIGMLYINQRTRHQVSPLVHGGGQEDGLRSGTINIPGIIGLASAIDFYKKTWKEERALLEKLETQFLKILDENSIEYSINADSTYRLKGFLSIVFKNAPAEKILRNLEYTILSRGSACNDSKNAGSHVLKAIGLSNWQLDRTIRVGFGRGVNMEVLPSAVSDIKQAINV